MKDFSPPCRDNINSPRFRSIEMLSAHIRAAATGMTRATDKFGRITAEVRAWSEQILKARVALSDEQTFYVRFGD